MKALCPQNSGGKPELSTHKYPTFLGQKRGYPRINTRPFTHKYPTFLMFSSIKTMVWKTTYVPVVKYLPVVRGLVSGDNVAQAQTQDGSKALGKGVTHDTNLGITDAPMRRLISKPQGADGTSASIEFHAPMTWQSTRPNGLLPAHVGLCTAATLTGLAVLPMVLPIMGAQKPNTSSAARGGA